MSVCVVLLLQVLGIVAAQDILKGEMGQEVSSCRCAGKGVKHGYCGYHLHLGSNEDKPWCRTKYNCGQSSIMSGSWMYCDWSAVERHWDGGRMKDAKEFQKEHGSRGRERWTGTKHAIERRTAENGRKYTVHEFRDYYVDGEGENGWVVKWTAARGSSYHDQGTSYGSGYGEKRQANDGYWYTREQFNSWYGSQASHKWAEAKRGEF